MVGFLWMKERPVTNTSTWQRTTFKIYRHRCNRRDSNPQSQQASGPQSHVLAGAFTVIGNTIFSFSLLNKSFNSLYLADRASFINSLFLFQIDTLLFSFIFFTFTIFLYMFRTGWSIIRRIKLHVQPLAPFPQSLICRAWPLVLQWV